MVHNGKTHLKCSSRKTVGHRLGEFAPTRSFRGHGGKAKAIESPAARRDFSGLNHGIQQFIGTPDRRVRPLLI